MSLSAEYSGVVINQNAASIGSMAPAGTLYQEFKLPVNYLYGSEGPQLRYPELSGVQLLMKIITTAVASVKLEIEFERHVFGEGWVSLGRGEARGVPVYANKVWVNLFLEKPIVINEEIAESGLRFSVKSTPSQQHWYVPTLSGQELYKQSSTPGPLVAQSRTLNYRILALTADSGTDFLGNPYRSIVVTSPIENTSTTQIDKGYWRSSPQPSKFAVVSNYFDMRFNPGDNFGRVNMIRNPSFEYDKAGTLPEEWSEFIGSEGIAGNIKVSSAWASVGTQSAKLISANLTNHKGSGYDNMWGIQTPAIPIKLTTKTFIAKVKTNVLKLPVGGEIKLAVHFFNVSNEEVGNESAVTVNTTGEHNLLLTATLPASSEIAAVTNTKVMVTATHANGIYEFHLDECLLCLEGAVTYLDGDMPGYTWLGTPGYSPSAEITPGIPEEAVVIDGIMLDPQTPNVGFNVYYSSDGDANEGTTTPEWEQKLWTRVPRSYVATQRQNYVFPEPIKAKYLKVEYSHLQPQNYNPRDFQAPTIYKKYPKWVANYFISQMKLPNFVANRIGISYDALRLSYEYYLDDLGQSTENIPALTQENEEKAASFFAQSDAANLVDPTTLGQINLIANQYISPPGLRADPSTLLGNRAHAVASLQTNYPVELSPRQETQNLLAVSQTERDNIVFEESIPIMYFYLTCRHAYKEVATKFPQNKAYFVGINEIAFLRNTYTNEFDEKTYIEPGIDTENLETNDFVISNDGIWSTF